MIVHIGSWIVPVVATVLFYVMAFARAVKLQNPVKMHAARQRIIGKWGPDETADCILFLYLALRATGFSLFVWIAYTIAHLNSGI